MGAIGAAIGCICAIGIDIPIAGAAGVCTGGLALCAAISPCNNGNMLGAESNPWRACMLAGVPPGIMPNPGIVGI